MPGIINGKYVNNPRWADNQQPPISADNLNDISDTLARLDAGGGGGKRYASLVVGTSTNGWTAADCDYLCDGTADNVEIQAAIDALPQGGEVVLLAGTYKLEGAITAASSGITIRGCGSHNTILDRNTAGGYGPRQFLVAIAGGSLRDLTYNGGRGMFPVSSGSTRYDVVLLGGTVQNCGFQLCADVALSLDNGFGPCFASGNLFQEGNIRITTATEVSIVGNAFGPQVSIHSAKLSNTNPPSVNISNNISQTYFEVYLEDVGHGSIISGNTNVRYIEITSTATSSTSSSLSTSCLVANNTMFPTSSSMDVIVLGENTRNIFVTGNLLTKWFNNPAPTIQDNGTDNIVKWNSTDT